MIQDLENHIFHNEYQPVPPKFLTNNYKHFMNRSIYL